MSSCSSGHSFLFALTPLWWTFHAVEFFDLERLMVVCKYSTIMFSDAVRVCSWYRCAGFLRQCLWVGGEAGFVSLRGVNNHTAAAVHTPLRKVIPIICYWNADNHNFKLRFLLCVLNTDSSFLSTIWGFRWILAFNGANWKIFKTWHLNISWRLLIKHLSRHLGMIYTFMKCQFSDSPLTL